ncbi:Crp/Fnr family transcriptional regulator [Neolewinella aurantiaca]|uniref:Crp/Fnr family transcriptional regulator n=1 Tax=Neolewinella aurantiaca TaxID=2602767 RepID=A0A5C7FRP4_9BACT|nr:Crp/Fnr family transcriptional regulator [Neolewinella aurantiaca]TXF90652.1 Crp/Fnr family transcriptional regulator [Neolewinella aurantiaca]
MSPAEIFKGIAISPAELDLITAEFKEVKYKKGDIILDLGDTVKYQYYVQSGCLRTFFIDEKDKEYTLQFGIKDWWVSDYTAYFYSRKAIMTIECLQDATLYRMSRPRLETLCRDIPALETFMRKKVEGGFSMLQKRVLSILSDSAEERYLAFLADYPEIERIVKNYHIASYLGITTESLSRIRKKLARQ